MKKLVWVMLGMAVTFGSLEIAMAHCEIPCGIYNDKQRIILLQENTDTIEKSMQKIKALSSGDNYNQLVRWIINKETHADNIQTIVTQYFMTQRIKPPSTRDANKEQKYARSIELLHKILVYAMKSKQTTDLEHVVALRKLIKDFENLL